MVQIGHKKISLWDILNRIQRFRKSGRDDTVEVTNASAMLQISEYRFFQIAYRIWYGRESDESSMDLYFKDYIINGRVPHWVRSLARKVLRRAASGDISLEEFGIKLPEPSLWMKIKGILVIILLAIVCILFYLIVIKDYTPYF